MTALTRRLRRPQGNDEAEALWPRVVYLPAAGVSRGRGGSRRYWACGTR
jgi:hypothetical protein